MKIAVTGASGFVGRPLVLRLRAEGHHVVPLIRNRSDLEGEVLMGDLAAPFAWRKLLDGSDVLVHLAARVHAMGHGERDAPFLYHEINTAATLRLAQAAAEADVRRFVFASTIKVNGEVTEPGRPFLPGDVPHPTDQYAISKHRAESGLWKSGRETGMEIVIVRPPLVHGAMARGNFATMANWVRRGVPFPFGRATDNLRSLVGIDNLVDLMTVLISAPSAANRLFLVADGQDVSTRGLLERLGAAMGRNPRFLPIPPQLLRSGARILGRGEAMDRLLGSLRVSIDETRRVLDWSPPLSLDEGLIRAVSGR